MKRKDLELVEQLSGLDNTSLEQIAMKFSKLIDTRKKKLSSAVSHKDTHAIIELSQFFRHEYLPVGATKILSQLDYDKNDRDFINHLMKTDNYSIVGSSRERILGHYLSQSLNEADFYHKINNDYPKELRGLIKRKFEKDSLKNVSSDIYLELMQICDLKLSMSNFKDYVENESFPMQIKSYLITTKIKDIF